MTDQLSFEHDIKNLDTQEIDIIIRGDEVLLLEEIVGSRADEMEYVIPDIAELFVKAVNMGMMSSSSIRPGLSWAKVTGKKADPENKTQSWRIKIQTLDPDALLVLLNMLRARELDFVSVKTVIQKPSQQSAQKLDPANMRFPSFFKKHPFGLETEEPMRYTRDRTVQIIFAKEPPDDVIEKVYEGFKVWSEMILLGGYAEKDMDPKESGAFPDEAFMFDAFTIEQSFPEAFHCDEAAFSAVINWGNILHKSCPIETIRIQ